MALGRESRHVASLQQVECCGSRETLFCKAGGRGRTDVESVPRPTSEFVGAGDV